MSELQGGAAFILMHGRDPYPAAQYCQVERTRVWVRPIVAPRSDEDLAAIAEGIRWHAMDIHKSALVGYSAESMFDLVEAAEHYPAFLPWCADAKILTRDESVVVANLTVNYHGVRFNFTTRNPKRRPEWLAVTLERGPFRRFEGEWRITALAPSACKIEFTFRYDFDAAMVRTLAGPVFDRIANTFVDAFVKRAEDVFGTSPSDGVATPTATGATTDDRRD
jgi:ribosome-associated toxin RatA of RatAB toxin-antitoxin module